MGTPLKICGLMRPEDVIACCRMGVDVCGFVVEYPFPVPWNLTRERCAALLPLVTPPAKSCIVTGGSREKILSLARKMKPDFVQLHYHETLDDTAAIVQALSPHGIGVIKTLPLLEKERLAQFGTEDIEWCAKMLCEAGVYAILVDSRGPENVGTAGNNADLSFYRRVKAASTHPVMLGGGIQPENCRRIIEAAHPDMLDVMTGVELAPGVKSEMQISRLTAEL